MLWRRWIPALLLLAALAVLSLPPASGVSGKNSGARVVQVRASRYAFEPAVLRVRPGERVTLELVPADVVHGLYLDGYGLELEADPGQTAEVSFIASEPGVFRIRCSVTCGPMHPFMLGRLEVGEPKRAPRIAAAALLALAAGVVPLLKDEQHES